MKLVPISTVLTWNDISRSYYYYINENKYYFIILNVK